MSYNMGCPVMSCDRSFHSGKARQKHGNAKKIIEEALKDKETEQRKCNNPVFFAEKTKDNIVLQGFDNAEDAWREVDECAMRHRVKVKPSKKCPEGAERPLRSDAKIVEAMIFKPDSKYINSLSYDEQVQYFQEQQIH